MCYGIKVLAAVCAVMIVLTGCGGSEVREYLTNEAENAGAGYADSSDVTETGGGSEEPEAGRAEVPEKVVVYVCGEVNDPGVYEFREGARVSDAVDAAGGFTVEADINYVNQAKLLEDGEKIRIPDTEETKGAAAAEDISQALAGEGSSGSGGLININTASKEELKSLSGIGDAKADSIIAYRQENGGFNDREEIKKVSGIGDSVYNSIKDRICTG